MTVVFPQFQKNMYTCMVSFAKHYVNYCVPYIKLSLVFLIITSLSFQYIMEFNCTTNIPIQGKSWISVARFLKSIHFFFLLKIVKRTWPQQLSIKKHSSEIRDLYLMNQPIKLFQNLPYSKPTQ